MKTKSIIHFSSVIAAAVLLLVGSSCNQTPKEEPIANVIERGLKVASAQALDMAKALENKEGRLPQSVAADTLQTSDCYWWCSGFFPGELWYLYEATGKEEFKHYADLYTKRIAPVQFVTYSHDVGFMVYDSYGQAYRLTKDTAYLTPILNAAQSLSTRFNEKIGGIQSWGSTKKWQFPIIIDNMMNLELMMEASKLSGNQRFRDIAVSHANLTAQNHLRMNASCFHVVSFDTITGKGAIYTTAQGYSDSSVWARGQAWCLYGFTMMYRETKDPAYLEIARRVAFYLMSNINMPEDKIPYWDYAAPDIPNAPRDASAAAIMASALIELSQINDHNPTDNQSYLQFAEDQIRVLSSPEYLAKEKENHGFLLKHSVGNLPGNSEVDVPLSYADYYYVEALLRLKKVLENQKQ